MQNGAHEIGPCRVATDDQTTVQQRAALTMAGCKTIFKDVGLSGATTKRPSLIRFKRSSNTAARLIVWRLKDSGTTRERELAVHTEVTGDARRAQAVRCPPGLANRYGCAVDVALHEPDTGRRQSRLARAPGGHHVG